jgi:hypothetical protein
METVPCSTDYTFPVLFHFGQVMLLLLEIILRQKESCYYKNINKNVFVDDIETHSIRIQQKEEVLAKVQATLKRSQEEANEIRKQIKREKQKQIDSL